MTDFGKLSRKCEADFLVAEGGGAMKIKRIADNVGEHEELVKKSTQEVMALGLRENFD